MTLQAAMTASIIIPGVTTAETCVPHWARVAISSDKWRLEDADCVVALRGNYLTPPAIPLSRNGWTMITLLADDDEVVRVDGRVRPPGSPDVLWHACGMKAGRHVFRVEPVKRGYVVDSLAVEPVTLELRPYMVVLVWVQPLEYKRFYGRTPGVRIQILDDGLARNGSWGRRWARRLGWPMPGNDQARAD